MPDHGDIIQWLNSARQDLADYKSHYDKDEFHRSLYDLQQASEKSAKATLMMVGLSSTKRAETIFKILGLPILKPKEYGHNWRKTFIDQLKTMSKARFTSIYLKTINIDKFRNHETTLAKAEDVKDIRTYSEEDLDGFIEISTNLLNAPENEDFRAEINSKLTKIRPTLDRIANLGNAELNVDSIIQPILTAIDLIFPLGALMILSLLLTPFEQMRYPSELNVKLISSKSEEFEKMILRSIQAVEGKIGD